MGHTDRSWKEHKIYADNITPSYHIIPSSVITWKRPSNHSTADNRLDFNLFVTLLLHIKQTIFLITISGEKSYMFVKCHVTICKPLTIGWLSFLHAWYFPHSLGIIGCLVNTADFVGVWFTLQQLVNPSGVALLWEHMYICIYSHLSSFLSRHRNATETCNHSSRKTTASQSHLVNTTTNAHIMERARAWAAMVLI